MRIEIKTETANCLMLMKIINYKLVQFSLVLSMGIAIGYFIDTDKPVTKVVYSEKNPGIGDSNSLSVINNQQQNNLQIEAEELRNRVASLEQQLISQQQTDSIIQDDDSKDDVPTEKLTVDNLLKVGVTEMIAQYIIARMSQLDFRLLDLHDRARREGYLNSPRYHKERREIMATAPSLRSTIGNDSYDHYLYTTGQKNRVVVTSVMSDSPADQLGVQKGDIVLNYANEKVLSWQDLRKFTSKGVYGEYVNLNILRNDQLINILVPRGPLGVRLETTVLDPELEYNY